MGFSPHSSLLLDYLLQRLAINLLYVGKYCAFKVGVAFFYKCEVSIVDKSACIGGREAAEQY